MGTWRRFLASRDNQSKDVSFDELRTWLCDHPTEGDGEESAVKDEQGRLAEVQQAQTTKEYEEYKKAKVNRTPLFLLFMDWSLITGRGGGGELQNRRHKLYPVLRWDGVGEGAKEFGHSIFPFCSPPSP